MNSGPVQISIIMPTKDRHQILLESVEYALKAIQNYNAEIIVINDGNHIPNFPSHEKLILLENNRQGVSMARNAGAKIAKASILFFIDDDMWITDKSLQLIFHSFNKNLFEENCFNLNWVYPAILQKKLKTKKIGRYILNSNYHTLEGRLHKKVDYSIPIIEIQEIGSCSFCISKKLFEKVGGYNEQITFQGEDIDLSKRIKQQGFHILLFTEITCNHYHADRLTINEYLDRIYRGYKSQAKARLIDLPIKKINFYSVLLPFFIVFKNGLSSSSECSYI